MHVSLKVYSVIGEEVASLVDELQEDGYHEVVFNAENLASGIYLYRLVAGDDVDSGRLVVMK
jgi:hypothetical protein